MVTLGSPLKSRLVDSEREFVVEATADALALAFAREVLRSEIIALELVSQRLDGSITKAARLLLDCGSSGPSVIVTGMGKAGLVGQKLAATLCSTGTPAFPLHPAEAVHGDLGRVRPGDVVIILSQSGETEEVIRLIPPLRSLGAILIAITSRADSSLGRACDLGIFLGPIEEACPMKLAPSASTTAMMAVGDALALLTSQLRGFQAEDFAVFHPGGSLGRKLGRVEDVMRTGRHIRIAFSRETIRDALIRLSGASRRTGAMMIVDDLGQLVGIFTDSDFARLFERRREEMLDRPIAESMTPHPLVVQCGQLVVDAIDVLKSRKLSELPVLDQERRPVGLIDVTDLIGLVPAELLEHDLD